MKNDKFLFSVAKICYVTCWNALDGVKRRADIRIFGKVNMVQKSHFDPLEFSDYQKKELYKTHREYLR